MADRREHDDAIRKHIFTEHDCKLCMRNAERLLDDASNNSLSIQTRMALLELSFEETAKSILLYFYLLSHDKGQLLVKGSVEENLRDIFKNHKTKIEIMKNVMSFLAENIPAFDMASDLDYIERIVRYGTEGEKRDSREAKISMARQIALDDRSSIIKKMVKEIIDFLNLQDVDYYNDLKNKSLYVDIDPSTDRLQLPLEPKNKKIMDYMEFFIIVQLADQWDTFGEKKKVGDLINKYRNRLKVLIK
ncbi:TVG0454214 [Thermoplasma volcanium GSS1]|uniref:TVG0454214 protein n=2 Tax=Thermoplasma volcanium TaxID=50339 RepID=Q97BJ0_THEVO|nr:TVG0454214 [Thermoplasma volcanium GSS1]